MFVDFRSLLYNKFVQVLLFVFVLNVGIFGLLWRLDVFVNTDLYSSGSVSYTHLTLPTTPYV